MTVALHAVVNGMWTFSEDYPWHPAAQGEWVRLSAECDDAAVGYVAALLLEYNQPAEGEEADGSWVLPGGLEIVSADGRRILPSCCAGLEDWPEWKNVAGTGNPYLGHSPDPWIEKDDGGIRVWSCEQECGTHEKFSVTIAADELRHLLDAVEKDIDGFSTRLREWLATRDLGFVDLLEAFNVVRG